PIIGSAAAGHVHEAGADRHREDRRSAHPRRPARSRHCQLGRSGRRPAPFAAEQRTVESLLYVHPRALPANQLVARTRRGSAGLPNLCRDRPSAPAPNPALGAGREPERQSRPMTLLDLPAGLDLGALRTLATGPKPTHEATALPDGKVPAISYLRVSTKDQATRNGLEEGLSIPAQRDAAQRKADQ